MPALRPALASSRAVRPALAVAAGLGALGLLASTFTAIIGIEVGTMSKVSGFDTHLSGGDRQGPALALLGSSRSRSRWAHCAARARPRSP